MRNYNRTVTSAAPSGALLLSQLGKSLFGSDWRIPTARALGINRRTVQRWDAGQNPVPAHAIEALCVELDRKIVSDLGLLQEARSLLAAKVERDKALLG